jgi:F0F1-type ATP synthase membrane subunit b/b'
MEINDIAFYLGKFEIAHLIVVGLMLWFFYSRLDSKMEKISKELREEIKQRGDEIKQQAVRSDRLYEMFIDLLKERKDPKTNP